MEADITDYLRDFGLTSEEAKVYYTLSKLGSAAASEVSELLSHSRIRTYRSLKGLLNKGLIEASLDRPRRYVPLDIEKALSLLEQTARNKILELENKRPLIVSEWPKAPELKVTRTRYAFRIIQGSSNVLRFNLSICESAKESIEVIIKWRNLFNAVTWGVDDLFAKLAEEKVRIKLLSEIGRSNMDAVEELMGFTEFRHASPLNFTQLAIVDGHEVIINLSDYTDQQNSNAIWTNHPELVAMSKEFFNAAWKSSAEGHLRIREIETEERPRS